MRMAKFFLAALSTVVIFIAGGCSKPALVYGERNSLHVASVQVNDNVAEPLRLNVAFRRTIAMKAGSLDGGNGTASGEAVSVFSSFDLDSDDKNSKTILDPIQITTKFASGNAARKIAGNTNAVAQILGVQLRPDSPAVEKLRTAAVECVTTKLTEPQVQTLATQFNLSQTRQNRPGVKEYISNMLETDLINLKTQLVLTCPTLS